MYIRFTLYFFVMLLALAAFSCQNSSTKKINEISKLDEKAKTSFTSDIIRYLGRKPEDASQENKFNSYFDEHYKSELKKHTLSYYFKDNSGRHFFVYTVIAPSMHLKKTAIGGFATFSKSGKVEHYEELFRTWKQEPDLLKSITDTLFTKMVLGESLASFYIKNSSDLGWIEFPNEEVRFDKENFYWVSSREDPLEPFKKEKIKQTEQLLEKIN